MYAWSYWLLTSPQSVIVAVGSRPMKNVSSVSRSSSENVLVLRGSELKELGN